MMSHKRAPIYFWPGLAFLFSLLLGACSLLGQAMESVTSVPAPPTPTKANATPTATIQAPTPSSSPLPTGTATRASQTPPVLGPGSIILPAASSAEPPVREYVCPWLEATGDIPHYTYQIVRTYPHDPKAYTEGLVYQDGFLYESTGLRGASSLRQVELETGRLLQKIDLPQQYFGEGIALFQGKIFQLTWQARIGFIYDAKTFDQSGTFYYQTEGWGMTQDGRDLIMSDGTNRLTFLDPESLQVVRSVAVTADAMAVNQLNELEYVNGEVWANVYLTSCVARIDPQSGQVLGWIDVDGMLSREEMLIAEVPNGIAFDPQTGRIFVTGKFWPKLFEMRVSSGQ